MLRLTLADNDIELYQNDPVNLSYQFSDLQKINSSASSFSQTFRVPLTKKNQEYFGAVNEFGLITTWDPKIKVEAELSYNTIPVMRGFAQVKNVYIQKGKYADVELVVFGETANLSRDIGNAMLTDADLSSYTETVNYTNVLATWTGSDLPVRFGVVDRGQNWSGSDVWSTTASGVFTYEVTGFLRVKEILTAILTGAGYTFDSTFIDSESDLYLMCNAGGEINQTVTAEEQALFHVGLGSNLTVTGTGWQTITAFVEGGAFFDNGSNVSSGVFTAPFDGLYQFKVRVKIDTLPTNHEFHVALFINGLEYATVLQGEPAELQTFAGYLLFTPLIQMDSGDTADVRFHFHTGSDTAILEGTGLISFPTTSFELYNTALAGTAWTANANMPVMKQIDFVSGLQKMFNLVFIPDRNNSKHLYIEPLGDYYAGGDKKDWTNKIDLSKDIQVEPTTDLQAREYEWKMSEGKDFVNSLVQKNAGRVYGRYRVNDPLNDFASGNNTIKAPFTPFVTSFVPDTDFIIHRMVVDTTDQDKSIKDPRPRLAYWNGYNNSGDWYYANQALSKFPEFSEYSADRTTIGVNDKSLLYGTERPFRSLLVSPLNTLYYKYWRPWVNELYSSDARKLTAYFRLTRSELANVEFSDKIFIKDTYWRILSISYDATTEDLVKVEMLKILGDIRDCSWLPYSVLKTGQLYFQAASGIISSSVPQNCCERYGYQFVSRNGGVDVSECWQNSPQ